MEEQILNQPKKDYCTPMHTAELETSSTLLKSALIILMLFFTVDVYLFAQNNFQRKTKSILVTSIERHNTLERKEYGDMSRDLKTTIYKCCSNNKIIGYAFVDNSIDAYQHNLYMWQTEIPTNCLPYKSIEQKYIQKAEDVLAICYDSIASTLNSHRQDPVIGKRGSYKKYIRQYAFYTNLEGDSCVSIYMHYSKDYDDFHLGMEFVQPCDGEETFLKTHINLSKNILIDWSVNGIG